MVKKNPSMRGFFLQIFLVPSSFFPRINPIFDTFYLGTGYALFITHEINRGLIEGGSIC